jgi:hypothetical protein
VTREQVSEVMAMLARRRWKKRPEATGGATTVRRSLSVWSDDKAQSAEPWAQMRMNGSPDQSTLIPLR